MNILLIALLFLQDQKKDLAEADAAMTKAKNYRFSVKTTVGAELKLSLEGEFVAPDLLHVRSDKGEIAGNASMKLVRQPSGDWKEPERRPGRPGQELAGLVPPHLWVARMVEQCSAVKREKSTKIDSVTVDIYAGTVGAAAAMKAADAAGHPFFASVVDWTRTRNGILFHVGRDELYRRVEQRFDPDGPGVRGGRIVIDFADFGETHLDVPAAVQKKLGVPEPSK